MLTIPPEDTYPTVANGGSVTGSKQVNAPGCSRSGDAFHALIATRHAQYDHRGEGHSARRHVVGGVMTPYLRRKQTVSSSTNRDHNLSDDCDGNWTRNHQGIGDDLILQLVRVDGQGRVRRRQRMGGVLNYYGRAA